MARWVLHVDMDQFIAAVEVLRRPELAGLPVIVGGRGDPTERASCPRRPTRRASSGCGPGCRSRRAVRRCPEAVLLPVDEPAYDEASAVVMDTLRAIPGAVVEVLGWDEAFVGIETDDPEAVARTIQSDVLAATRLHCSVGIGDTKVRAKIATEFGKPRGMFRLTRDNWFEVMGHRKTKELWGIGSRISERLAGLGIETVLQLAQTPDEPLIAEFGPNTGPHIGRLGRGVSSATVDDTPWVARAHGRETTYQQNLETLDDIAASIHVLAAQVVEDIRREGRACFRVHLKVRFAPFFTVNRSPQAPRADLRPSRDRRDRPRPLRPSRGHPPDPPPRPPRRDGPTGGWLRPAPDPRPPRQPLTLVRTTTTG